MRYGPGFDRPDETRDGRKIAFPVNKDVLPGPETAFTSIGERWANVANTPYRYAKAQSYEGGIHTPMIASWPAVIKSKGKFSNHMGHVMDFMATFIDIGKATYPRTFNGHQITPTPGISLLPAFEGKEQAVHDTLYNEHFRARYIRDDEWKLVSLSSDTIWHLYRINDDQTELNDLSAKYPDVVKMLSERWRLWANSHKVFPKPSNQ